ncbi:hypothetical protein [Flavivirga jejuensis]|uniref:Uncharacterized protein n=1 Tax=Flavivirga jejuensis TaxID=870487 RepID=A0ABT8WKY0_9FLAO|nr:hypothetical protein [Flavivirga jejuensis]MDO5973616.1 hypothetical protein [Flavivirga jejuensis]
MKKNLIILLFMFPIFSWADHWDNLTLQQANQVQDLLNSNPYILDYCDCCSYEGVYATKIYLMKVKSTDIVICDWNSEYFNVRAQVEILAEIPYNQNGPDIASPRLNKSESDLIITMNYTWAYNELEGKAAPIYTIIPYDTYGKIKLDSGSCREFTTFPKPKYIKERAYKRWYRNKF